MIAKALDERAAKIRNELDEAQRLREEAQQLLAEYQSKRKEAEKEAADIVAAAKREADLLVEEAHKKTEEYVARRTALAEQKIGQAERERSTRCARAPSTSPSRRRASVLAGKLDAKAGAELFKDSLKAVQTKLN